MKKFFISCLFVTLLIVFVSCGEEEKTNIDFSNKGTFLTINEDTREIANDGTDPDLKIGKTSRTGIPDYFRIDSVYHLFELNIYDPNQSLIANIGNYNTSERIRLRFAFPTDFRTGTYNTIGLFNQPTDTHITGTFEFSNNFWVITDEGFDVSLSETSTANIIEFREVNFTTISTATNQRTVTISGRIEINK